jgi:hypothetical protein
VSELTKKHVDALDPSLSHCTLHIYDDPIGKSTHGGRGATGEDLELALIHRSDYLKVNHMVS